MSKRNIWVLPLNTKYKITDIEYSQEGCFCENCGRAINNIAVIESLEKRVFNVWLDCASTLEDSEIDNLREYTKQKKEFNKMKSLLTVINKIHKNNTEHTLTIKQGREWEYITVTYRVRPEKSFTSSSGRTIIIDRWLWTVSTYLGLGKYREQANEIIKQKLLPTQNNNG